MILQSLSLSLHFNGHFPGKPGLASLPVHIHYLLQVTRDTSKNSQRITYMTGRLVFTGTSSRSRIYHAMAGYIGHSCSLWQVRCNTLFNMFCMEVTTTIGFLGGDFLANHLVTKMEHLRDRT